MMRQSRLALPEHLNQLAHRKVMIAQQREQAQPGWLTGSFQFLDKIFDRAHARHINIHLYDLATGFSPDKRHGHQLLN
jgi:hypothetical protein